MASESAKLERAGRELVLALRKTNPIVLNEAARLVESRAKELSIAPSGASILFDQLTALGWEGVRPDALAIASGPSWHVVLSCKVCLTVISSDPIGTRERAKSMVTQYAQAPALHSDFQHLLEDPCHGLCEVLGLGR